MTQHVHHVLSGSIRYAVDPEPPRSEHLYAKVQHAIYQTPEIFHCVADIVGDSLALTRKAMQVEADIIVVAGVHFMAETAKLLNSSKTILIPNRGAGCLLADSITPEDVMRNAVLKSVSDDHNNALGKYAAINSTAPNLTTSGGYSEAEKLKHGNKADNKLSEFRTVSSVQK